MEVIVNRRYQQMFGAVLSHRVAFVPLSTCVVFGACSLLLFVAHAGRVCCKDRSGVLFMTAFICKPVTTAMRQLPYFASNGAAANRVLSG